ncbi:MAG: hypothetical protein GY910_13760 [bacterium]|nr:hypothetical protein [Deltaproteobacteria bacterium]MCP4906038.1 hypothetical protein [bacterium]
MSFKFDSDHIDWHQIRAEPSFDEYKLAYEYSILGHDKESGTLDMLMRWAGDGGHCERHRHTGVTSTLVLEGEQHLDELLPDGSIRHKVRRAGDYALSLGVEPPHLERGGPEGGIALLSMHTSNGLLFEILDAELKVLAEISIEELVTRWGAR